METRDRRRFLKQTAAGLGAAGLAAAHPLGAAAAPTDARETLASLPRQGPKPVARGKKAVASSSHPAVTRTMLDVLAAGGNAADAAVAGSLMSATVEPHMTNHGGSVTFLHWDARTGEAVQLNSTGTLVPGLPAFRPYPPNLGGFAEGATGPAACIPGFMPGLGAIHGRFGSRPWGGLCEPAIAAAEEGHTVHSFEYGVLEWEKPSNTYFPAGRDLFTPEGFTPAVGERFKNPELARTLRRLAAEGPEYFIRGEWARHFVAAANRIGWPIELGHMAAVPPRWQDPLRFTFRGHEVLQLAPPERVGATTAFFLGVLEQMGLGSLGSPLESADSLYLFAHALRWVEWELGRMQDPELFDVPIDVWLSAEHHRHVAEVIRRGMPRVDLSEHVRLAAGKPALAAAGLPTAAASAPQPGSGSCELSVVDEAGNWVEMMNTLQSGGLPGMVVDGVPMVGSHVSWDLNAPISGWLTGGGRLSLIIGNTIVLKDGRPWLALGTPGAPHRTVPQVLAHVLLFGMDPYQATTVPRIWPLRDDYVLEVESRIPEDVVAGLARRGIQVRPLNRFEWHMGSFQVCWRDADGRLNASTDPRRAGWADGL
jgi:gamma-glutamyltranspeptidase / glutathione hydrolase